MVDNGTELSEVRIVLQKILDNIEDKEGVNIEELLASTNSHIQFISTLRGQYPVVIERPRVAIFFGSHGYYSQKKSSYIQELQKRLETMHAPNSAVRQWSQLCDTDLRIFDMNIATATQNTTDKSAMTGKECLNAIAYGMTVVEEGVDCLCIDSVGDVDTITARSIMQILHETDGASGLDADNCTEHSIDTEAINAMVKQCKGSLRAVSYTHLTLPTICSV